jgi:prohibitin 1
MFNTRSNPSRSSSGTGINIWEQFGCLGSSAIFLALFAAIFLRPFTIVGPGERGVVMRLGQVQNKVLDEGIHPIMPIVTSVKRINVRIRKSDIQVPAGTKDLQIINVEMSLNWHISPDKANLVYQQIGSEEAIVDGIIKPAMTEILKAATPRKTAEEVLRQRDELKQSIDSDLKKRLLAYNLIVDDVSLVNVSFSEEFSKAIEAKQIAEQQAKQAEYVVQSAAREAEAQVNRAKGQAEAQRLIRQTITPELLQKQAIEKWDGKFPTVMGGQGALPLINVSPGKAQ